MELSFFSRFIMVKMCEFLPSPPLSVHVLQNHRLFGFLCFTFVHQHIFDFPSLILNRWNNAHQIKRMFYQSWEKIFPLLNRNGIIKKRKKICQKKLSIWFVCNVLMFTMRFECI